MAPEYLNERRWNPFLQKWIIVAPARGSRPVDSKNIDIKGDDDDIVESSGNVCPFCVGAPEVPEPFDVLVLPNKFSALSLEYTETVTALREGSLYKVAPAIGHQEVVLYSPDHHVKFKDLPHEHLVKLVRTWQERYRETGVNPAIKYVFEFENRGKLVGVSLDHPHGQIYSFGWIPLYVRMELESFKSHHDGHGRCLLCDIIKEERELALRIVSENDSFISCVPFFAAWPHELHVYPKAHLQCITDLDEKQVVDLAAMLKDVNIRYDNLYPGDPMDFVMAMHQKPTDGKDYNYYHYHIEFYPPVRARGKQKWAGGVEQGTGTWINSSQPEEFARRMRVLDGFF